MWVELIPLLILLHCLYNIFKVGVEDKADNLSTSKLCDKSLFCFDLIQPSSSLKRRAKCLSSWSKGWPEGSARKHCCCFFSIFSLFSLHLLDAGGDGGDDQHQSEAHHGPVLSHPSMDWTNYLWCSIAMSVLNLRRSLWLQRRRLGIQQWVKSAAGGKPRRHGTRCSWEHVFESKPDVSSNLLKTILTSAWLISPVLSINNFQSWISYSKSCLFPVKITHISSFLV